jgi:hypothetical protein
MHLVGEQFAVIQPGEDGASVALPSRALLLTTLLPTFPHIFLNVCTGDQAELVRRACGCGMDLPGRAFHLHTVRSFEKLTAHGMTFLDTDLIRALEEFLPARFGGGQTDYQLVEGESEEGRPEVRLLIDPAVGPLDPAAVADVLLDAIGRGNEGERLMALQWRQTGLLRVERRRPFTTASAKLLHLHQDRSRP